MAYKIDNAIIKKDRNGRVTLIDPENVFGDEDAFIAVKSIFIFSPKIPLLFTLLYSFN